MRGSFILYVVLLQCSLNTITEQEMCASQNTPVYINQVFPLPQGNHVAKFGQDLIYRTKVVVRKQPVVRNSIHSNGDIDL